MNILKGIGAHLWGSGDSQGGNQLLQIGGGELLQEKNGKELTRISPANALIQKTGKQYTTVLVISKDNGTSNDLEDEPTFPIVQDMQFYSAEFAGQLCFCWRDPEGIKYRFIPPDAANRYTLELFENTLLKCMYETKFQASAENVADEELVTLKGNSSSSSRSGPSISPQKPATSKTNLAYSKVDPEDLKKTKELLKHEGQLFWFDPLIGQYRPLIDRVNIYILQRETFTFYFHVADVKNGETYTFQRICPEMNPTFYHNRNLSISFCTEEDGRICSWGCKIPDETKERELSNLFAKCYSESLKEESFSKLKDDEQRYIFDGLQSDEEMTDYSEAESSEEDDAEDNYRYTPRKGEKNKSLTVGYKYDRSYVVKGSQLDVYKHGDDSLERTTTIKEIKTLDGKTFSPAKTMLHYQDSSMVLTNASNQNTLYKMDLTRGEVVEEWGLGYMSINDICPEDKYAQREAKQTFVGMSDNAIFLIDPRQSGSKQVESMTKQYAHESNNKFNCTATTENGQLAVASKKGDIRLFSDINKNAKTHLPGLGDPILGIDVTADGKYVLATCKTYLLVIPTQIKDSDVTGFAKSMGQNKPVPKRLVIKSEDVVTMGCQISFTPARFNVGEDLETTIVSSSGPYVIIWNFRRIKLGHLYDYKIRKYEDTIVADNFKFGQHKSILVALPDDVTLVKKSKLSTPQKIMKKSE